MTTLLTHIKRNAVAYLALFVALGGTSYAAIKLPAGSVGTKQLRNGAVTNRKLAKHAVGAADLDRKSIAGYVRAWAQIDPTGRIISSRPRAHVITWAETQGTGAAGGLVGWNQRFPPSCFALTTSTGLGVKAYASTYIVGGTRKSNAGVGIELSAVPATVAVAVICPGR